MYSRLSERFEYEEFRNKLKLDYKLKNDQSRIIEKFGILIEEYGRLYAQMGLKKLINIYNISNQIQIKFIDDVNSILIEIRESYREVSNIILQYILIKNENEEVRKIYSKLSKFIRYLQT